MPSPPSFPPRLQLAAALEDVRWAVDHGLRSVLVADLGLQSVIGKLVKAGKLPSNLVSKISVSIGPHNPVRGGPQPPAAIAHNLRTASPPPPRDTPMLCLATPLCGADPSPSTASTPADWARVYVNVCAGVSPAA